MVLSELDGRILLSEINLAGTHDSCTAFVSLENMARCQSLTVKEQLNLGIRLFDIRLNRSRHDFFLVHSLADCYTDSTKKTRLTFSRVLQEFEDFLRDNPTETIVVSVKQDRGIMSRWFFPVFYDKYIRGNEKLWYLKNKSPRLDECRGKIVLMRRCKVWSSFCEKNEAGLDFSHWKDQAGLRKTNTETIDMTRHAPSEAAPLIAEIQDRYSLDVITKWKKSAKPFLNRAGSSEADFRLHFLSTSFRKKGETLVETAREMNAYFMSYELKKDRAQGWFFLDFPDEELVAKINAVNRRMYLDKEVDING